MKYKKTSIIILAYKEPKKFKKMFETLLKHTHQKETPYEIIIVNNSYDINIYMYIKTRIDEIRDIVLKVVDLPKNVGTSKGFNIGVAVSEGYYLCFFNSDYYMMDNWLKSMIDCFEHKKNIGLVSCCTNCTGNIVEKYQTITQLPNDYMDAECAIAQMFTTKKIWEEVGGFSEEFFPVTFEDLDFNEKIKEKGYKIFVNRKCFGYHDYAMDKGKDRKEIMDRNRIIFKKKWGDKYKWA